jgi:nitrogen fixation protein FixH
MRDKINFPLLLSFVMFGILISGLFYVLTVAMNNKVDMDDSYFDNYQTVDKNYNQIQEQEIAFNQKYSIVVENSKLQIGDNQIILKVIDKNTTSVISNAKIEAKFTRPYSSKMDEKLNLIYKDNLYISNVNIKEKGRWQLKAMITVGEEKRFFVKEMNASI